MRLSDELQTLNRTLLQRQLLLERAALSAEELAVHLVGLQAQDSLPPYIGMFSRVTNFDPLTLSGGLESRSLVRATLMRGTIHLVVAEDALRMRSIFQPEFEKTLERPGFFSGALSGLDTDELRKHGEAAFDDGPRTAAQVRASAEAAFPDRDPQAVAQAWYYQVPVLQVPPRGMWRKAGRPIWSRIDSWLEQPLITDYSPADLVARYLAAFGPASTQDIAVWARLPGIAELVEQLGTRLRTYQTASGQTLYDVADAELADPELEAPVRFLGWYDNVFLGHKDRSRIVSTAVTAQIWERESRNISPVLIDGFIKGGYRVTTGKTREPAEMRIRLIDVPRSAEPAVEAEAVRLLKFLEPDRSARIEFVQQL
ncbi:winged helix DNA-binding domain-containing protein [Hoyosella subflava]|uniref:Winged helix DNA-binding domain-containing protein n=1 Tax=Hoyosella subflava (strain DSM 45089 / JCM 17490 / NBRC 109087 / DQS3-9A1) TaxID=443218 RepID=F6EMY7_HOYSD|nr:winged helix DNA-binding domain-containing protein [Hoyosella subflava]AEF42879.1 hypothetical protein AS9A_4446 [Hoyosella subflava DQS3-9A1]